MGRAGQSLSVNNLLKIAGRQEREKMDNMTIAMINTQMCYLLFGIDTKSAPHAINKQWRLVDKNKLSL